VGVIRGFFHTFGEGKGGGERSREMPFLPLTLSPKGRGEITFNHTRGGMK